MQYEHEETDVARRDNGILAANPAKETVHFDITVFSLRYGLTSQVNLNASLPLHSIRSDKFQGAYYLRQNRGLGDLYISAEFAVLSSPHVTLEAGLKLGTGNIDKTDAFGQRICDILALGSGTTDPVIGAHVWLPHTGVPRLNLVGSVRHRFSGGQNKWGYQFGASTDFNLHGSYPLASHGRVGLRVEGYHTEADYWLNLKVPERGATMLYAGPTASWTFFDDWTVGGFLRTPIFMRLAGSQMVARSVFGLEFSTNLNATLGRLGFPGKDE